MSFVIFWTRSLWSFWMTSLFTPNLLKNMHNIWGAKRRQYQLFAKAPKCCFAVFEIDFIGQKVTPAGMSPTEEKIRAVKEWQRPNDVTDVRSFLGFANFYRRYIYKFAKISAPLK